MAASEPLMALTALPPRKLERFVASLTWDSLLPQQLRRLAAALMWCFLAGIVAIMHERGVRLWDCLERITRMVSVRS